MKQILGLYALFGALMFLGRFGENQIFLFRLLLPFVGPVLILIVVCIIGYAVKARKHGQSQGYWDEGTKDYSLELTTQNEDSRAGEGQGFHAGEERDAVEVVYQKPHIASAYIGVDEETRSRFDRENEEYDLQWCYSSGQRDRLEDRHMLPHSPIDHWGGGRELKEKYGRERKAYQDGWNNADDGTGS